MALRIVSACVGCWACLDVCPNGAVVADGAGFAIDAEQCTECLGDYPEPQCAAICPVEGAIVDGLGEALNPPGALTALPPAPHGGLPPDRPAP